MMAKQRQMMLKEPIKRFLIQCVAKSGPEPEPLMNELELCRKFNVSRITVHRAVEDLLKVGYIIHLPKRRGVFSNPQYAQLVPYSIGILSVCANCTYVDSYSKVVLAAFLNRIMKLNCMCTFLTLEQDPENIDSEIENIGLDGVFWMTPDDCYIPAVNRLIDKGFPIVSVTPHNPNFTAPKGNYAGTDYEYSGFCRAEYFIKRGCRRVAFCGKSVSMYEKFVRRMTEAGVFADGLHMEDSDAVNERLPGILDEGKIDGLFCEWENSLHYTVLKILHEHPFGKSVKVLLSNGLSAPDSRSCFPGLQIDSLFDDIDYAHLTQVGKEAGKMMCRILASKDKREKPVLFRCNMNY